MATEKVKQPELAKHDSSVLDLAFVMDCTGSMGSYINIAKDNIRNIVEEIVASEKSNVALALVEYRDHPPQDASFVTKPHDFTGKVGKMKTWLDGCSASGGGDGPEAVADGLHQLLKLSWRKEATKIAVLISDAPPHGLGDNIGDGFPKGCPDKLDPLEITGKLAEKGVTLYVVGCEPAIVMYKDFFMGLAYITGGQYVPLTAAKSLTKVIIGGAQEELSLEAWMEEVNINMLAKVEAKGAENLDEEMLAKELTEGWASRGVKGKKLTRNAVQLVVSEGAKTVSAVKNLADYRSIAPTLPAPSPAASGGFSMGDEEGDEEIYECSADDIDMGQARRMVQKSKMRNVHLFK